MPQYTVQNHTAKFQMEEENNIYSCTVSPFFLFRYSLTCHVRFVDYLALFIEKGAYTPNILNLNCTVGLDTCSGGTVALKQCEQSCTWFVRPMNKNNFLVFINILSLNICDVNLSQNLPDKLGNSKNFMNFLWIHWRHPSHQETTTSTIFISSSIAIVALEQDGLLFSARNVFLMLQNKERFPSLMLIHHHTCKFSHFKGNK